jgi:hypothetical protein
MQYTDLPFEIDDMCRHRHMKVFTRGGMHFDEGEVWDDITEMYVCLDCSRELSQTEVRAVWLGHPILFPNPRKRRPHGR